MKAVGQVMGIHGNILCIHQYENCFLTVQKEYKRRSKQSKINIIKSCHFDLITKMPRTGSKTGARHLLLHLPTIIPCENALVPP